MVAAVIRHDAYRTEVTSNGHQVIADEPQERGGQDLGPGPGEFLMISLATCTAITLRMYANRKQWAVEKIRVEVNEEIIDKTTVFARHIYVEGAIDEIQRGRLLQIANACPVHKTLTNPIEIKTQIL
jgi:putative redox protein